MCGLANTRKHAVETPADPNSMHITMIWYRTAINGETPDKIWPVIIPGSETNPTANNELVIGMSAARSAMPRAAS